MNLEEEVGYKCQEEYDVVVVPEEDDKDDKKSKPTNEKDTKNEGKD